MDTENKKSCIEFKIINRYPINTMFPINFISQTHLNSTSHYIHLTIPEPTTKEGSVLCFGVSRFRILWNLKSSMIVAATYKNWRQPWPSSPLPFIPSLCGFCCPEAWGPTKLVFPTWLSFVSNTNQEVKLLEGRSWDSIFLLAHISILSFIHHLVFNSLAFIDHQVE